MLFQLRAEMDEMAEKVKKYEKAFEHPYLYVFNGKTFPTLEKAEREQRYYNCWPGGPEQEIIPLYKGVKI